LAGTKYKNVSWDKVHLRYYYDSYIILILTPPHPSSSRPFLPQGDQRPEVWMGSASCIAELVQRGVTAVIFTVMEQFVLSVRRMES
jgi:hypothetical protein